VLIREVTYGDLSRVVALLQQLWPEKQIEHEKLWELLEEYIKESDYRIYGYEEEGVLLGISTVSLRWALFYGGRVAIIEDLIVDKDHRGEGIGRKLVRFVEDRMAEDGEVKGIEVSSDLHRKTAHEFWERCGYSKLAFQFRKGV
jgi:GNAT superfamily N-acetyltransferase